MSNKAFNQQFDQHSVWRRGFALRLKLLVEWMKDHELINAAVEERLKRLEGRMRTDKVMVAFVAEYSRGKSELINALFFADFGRRIMPASAGRTTMCPTEIGYESGQGTSLRLLPIESRLQSHTLMDWRMLHDQWTRIDLDVTNPDQLAAALNRVSDVCRVTVDQARELGLWQDGNPQDNPSPGKDGLVEVPKWRHALINIAHPLLRQGLVILDTPGLNAIGAEPELTVSLIPQANAVVFLLAADTGVTKSDLAMWQDHLSGSQHQPGSRLVVLNKIDTLWDGLNSTEQVQRQVDRQRQDASDILGVPLDQVLAVSAQKGLVAKVNNDEALLETSCLAALEKALADSIIGQRQVILRNAVVAAVEDLRTEASRMLHIRRRDLSEQAMELRGLDGKNANVARHLKSRVEQERLEFDQSGAKIHAVKSVHMRLLKDLFRLLSGKALSDEMLQLTATLTQSGLKFGVKRAYADTFEHLRTVIDRAQESAAEITTMLTVAFRQLNADFGFSLQPLSPLSLGRYREDLDAIERSHNQYVGIGSALTLARSNTANRLVRALKSRLRIVYESAQSELELWSKSATSQLDAQLLERRHNFTRRIDAIERVQQAAGELGERLVEIEAAQLRVQQNEDKLTVLSADLLNAGIDQNQLPESSFDTPAFPAIEPTALQAA